uniref:Uncharacterized protein n=1 Tax=Plectus sambesii TaxID=2011161 RepID=A0A914VH96_9BILA
MPPNSTPWNARASPAGDARRPRPSDATSGQGLLAQGRGRLKKRAHRIRLATMKTCEPPVWTNETRLTARNGGGNASERTLPQGGNNARKKKYFLATANLIAKGGVNAGLKLAHSAPLHHLVTSPPYSL